MLCCLQQLLVLVGGRKQTLFLSDLYETLKFYDTSSLLKQIRIFPVLALTPVLHTGIRLQDGHCYQRCTFGMTWNTCLKAKGAVSCNLLFIFSATVLGTVFVLLCAGGKPCHATVLDLVFGRVWQMQVLERMCLKLSWPGTGSGPASSSE